jgi:hypothetical protein
MNLHPHLKCKGAWGSVVVKALRYKSEGPGIDSRCRRGFSDSSMCPGVDSASENYYQANSGGKGSRCVRLTTYHLHVPMSRSLGALNSWNPVGLFRPVMRQLYLYLKCKYDNNTHTHTNTHTHHPCIIQILFHIIMKHLPLQITYKFTKKNYSQYQQISCDQTAQTKTAPFMSYFINSKDFVFLYIHVFYCISF